MATALDLIDRSLRMLSQIGSGETASTDEAADGLEALNALLETWRNERLMAYAFEELTLTLSNSTASYTIGSGGSVNTTRPVDIEEAWIVDSNTSYPVMKMTEEQYVAIPDKTTTSDWPDRFLYRPSMATGTIIVHPVPNATRTMKLLVRTPVTAFATTGTTVTLPPGWERALAANLAMDLAPEFETEPSAALVRMARESKAALKSNNRRPVKANNELSFMFGARSGNILTDV